MSEIRVDTISEKTSANGVAIDSVTLKDGGATLADNITFSASGKGVHLGVTSATSSNLLDDYEEGSFSVEVADALSGGNSNAMVNSGDVDGVYTKIGDMVFFSIAGTLNTTGLTGTDAIFLRGLPFTANNKSNFYECTNPRIAGGVSYNLSSGFTQVMSMVPANSTYLNFREQGDSQTTKSMTVNQVVDDTSVRVQGMYHTDS